ncbi:MAG: hypothetical protein ACRD8U_11385, partial [Pyrinomonadaceae bacterium]
MKLPFLYSVPLACVLLVLPVSLSASYSQSPSQSPDAITESKVLAIINSVDRAARKGNVSAILAPLAKDVKIKMTLLTPTGEQVLNFTKEQYAFHTRRGFRRRLAYQLERKNTRVKINEDGKT